jgi:RNA polymerase sigma-70 factor (ECF subfamily)
MPVVSAPDTTCWTIIEGAAGGVDADIARFIDLYGPVVHAYLRARWRGKPAEQLVDDAVQDVFLECFKEGGVLERAKGRGLVSFRGFLVGVARNVSLRYETAKAKNPEVRAATSFEPADPSAESELARVFDRAWAEAMVRDASARQAERARIIGADAVRRVELLDLHFSEGLPIRDIAKRCAT